MMFMVYLATTDLHMAVAVIYGLALIALFSVSTAFHLVSYTGWLRYFSYCILWCFCTVSLFVFSQF